MSVEYPGAGKIPAFDGKTLGQLACPVCFGALRLAANTVVCVGCGRVYPMIDGIPVLIAERAAASR